MKSIRVGINGFGRIGRAFTRIAIERETFEIVHINTGSTPPEMLAYLLKYDSTYRTFKKSINHNDSGIEVDGKSITSSIYREPEAIPWGQRGVDVVIDATGAFKTREELKKHLHDGVKKVILTAPTSDETLPHIVLGANDDRFDFGNADIISNASCTTNCASLMTRVLDDHFKINSLYLTTVHAYTSSQQLLDNSADKPTRARSAGLSIIPTTTGAADAICKTTACEIGNIGGMALRVPVPVGSISDITAVVERHTNIEEIHQAFKSEAEGRLKSLLSYEESPIVSSDCIGTPYSCIYDANYTQVLNGNFIKIFGWYDNEWGYSTRLVDLTEILSDHV